jgi:glycosyltransferase involved in cell wall biosynthesis
MPQHQVSDFFLPLAFDKNVNSGLGYYQQPIAKLEVPGFSPFFGLQLAIWQLRTLDLQKLYPLDSIQGRKGFLAWCVVHGSKEYAALRELQVFWDALAQPAIIPATLYSGAITRLMQLIALSRLDLHIDSALSTEGQQFRLLQWFCFHGWKELGLRPNDIADCQKPYFEKNPSNNISFIEAVIYASRLELQNRFNLLTVSGQTDYNQWLQEVGRQETILNLLSPQASDSLPKENKPALAFGVNLIGYAFGELGIGEDVRMAALALEAANIRFTVINFRPGDDIRQNDRSIAQWVTNDPIYAVNILCLTALEHLRLYAEQGEALFKDRYTIGYWPWELQNWPTNWQHCFSLVDEVWVSSQHTWQAAQKVSSVPLYLMPMAVAIPKIKRYTRKQWSLPETEYLFVFSFDGNSSLARKNPLGVIEAFKLAFPNGHEAAGLVIKCMRPDANNPSWQLILKLAASDSRIHIIDQMLSKPEVLGLYKVCDCFVSLHRAEGFGRGIAEALLLGLNVIATNHGGNVDFCLPGYAYLVCS